VFHNLDRTARNHAFAFGGAHFEKGEWLVSVLVVYAGSGLSTIDAKGRTTIPAELRDSVATSSGDNAVCLARHPALPCLIGFGRTERSKLREDVESQWQAALQRGAEFDRELAGVNASSIFETAFEASGRFVVSPIHRHFGKLAEKAFFFGATTHFMLWNPEIFRQSAPPAFAHVLEELEYWETEHERRGK
jgi:MraZ protein